MAKQQQTMDFTSRQAELLSLCAGVRNCRIEGISRGRINGVVELLQRMILLARELADPIIVEAQVVALAARIQERKTVCERTVRNWISDAKDLGFVRVDYLSHEFGGTAWNRYVIEAQAIRSVVLPSSDQVVQSGRQRAATGGNDFRPRGGNDFRPRGGNDFRPSYGRDVLSRSKNQEPVPDTASDDFGLSKVVDMASGLAAYTTVLVHPLPARSLATDGCFAVLAGKHVRSPGLIVTWFRRQLSAPSPVTGGTEAHLLLVLGAAVYASEMAADDVLVNRTAVFISTISRRRWSKVLRHLAAARSQLDEMRGSWPLVGERTVEVSYDDQ